MKAFELPTPIVDSTETTSLNPWVKFSMAVACLLGILAVAASNTIIDLDLFHQVSLFREFLANGAMPMTDSFAYTPTREIVVHHEWGMGAIQYYAMEGSGLGNAGLMILKYGLAFSICLVCYVVARKNGAPFALIVLLSPIALSVGGYIGFTNVRAQVVTLLFLAIEFWMFSSDRAGKRLWCLAWIPLMIAWTNIHGGVVAGAAIFAFWVGCRFVEALLESNFMGAVREGAHRIGLALILPVLMCVNPYGAAYVPYLIRAVQMKRPMIGEWSSIWGSGDTAMLLMFGLALFVAVVAAVAIYKRGSGAKSIVRFLFPVSVIVLTWIMASKNMRHVSIFAVAWICYAPMLLSQTEFHKWVLQSVSRNQQAIKKASLAFAMVALAISLNARFWAVNVPAFADDAPVGSPIYPVHAMNFLEQENIGGNMMVWFNDGAYVSWRMFPQIKVSLDSRYEVAYPHGAVEESVAFYNAEDSWRETLEKYPTDMVLAPTATAICETMDEAIATGELSWKVIYRDESFVLFRKSEALAVQ
ncbi:hypothetical protein [Mariniblastus fucicola]|uniref:Glycosyltransferase RgtA/B/C/D-like domain-containing protein n=1 Tax=Mariniblastus fucicola TaxID=980251 RepID=A0A5B9P6P1_9BACT|nr:hypothetical protein [Mariniblastus fucicola]QEG21928.1 hypothetical protein MFFC18_17890 [Mariniblastus fucicola]